MLLRGRLTLLLLALALVAGVDASLRWVGEEALAIAIYCALVAGDDFDFGVRLAVNHGGDSDSTGAIAGNILGALLGRRSISDKWLEKLELRDAIEQVATDLFLGFQDGDEWWGKYPGH